MSSLFLQTSGVALVDRRIIGLHVFRVTPVRKVIAQPRKNISKLYQTTHFCLLVPRLHTESPTATRINVFPNLIDQVCVIASLDFIGIRVCFKRFNGNSFTLKKLFLPFIEGTSIVLMTVVTLLHRCALFDVQPKGLGIFEIEKITRFYRLSSERNIHEKEHTDG